MPRQGRQAPTSLGTQTNHGRFSLDVNAAGALDLTVAYDRREKTGAKWGFGPVGDRPPRTLNVQFAEPVDYLTNDLTVAAEHDGGSFQVRGEFLYSEFAHGIDTVRWDNVWASGAPGADGFGTSLHLVPDRLTLLADYTASLADVDLTYAGFGVTNWNGTPFPPNHQFAFSTPPTTTEDLHVFNLRFEIPVRMFTAILGYAYESYRLSDWQEGGVGSWVETVGADTLLRDSSRSFQWGNRLFNLGTYLAPSYDAHLGFVGLSYRF